MAKPKKKKREIISFHKPDSFDADEAKKIIKEHVKRIQAKQGLKGGIKT